MTRYILPRIVENVIYYFVLLHPFCGQCLMNDFFTSKTKDVIECVRRLGVK